MMAGRGGAGWKVALALAGSGNRAQPGLILNCDYNSNLFKPLRVCHHIANHCFVTCRSREIMVGRVPLRAFPAQACR